MSYFPSITQNVTPDANNTSTANLAAGASFTGVHTSTLGVNAIQVIFKADQNFDIQVQQSNDHVNWDVSDTFKYNVVKDNFSTTVQAVGAYVRIVATNRGSATTTYLRLATSLCPIVEAIPRAVSDNGNSKVGIYELEDEYGFHGQFTPFNALLTTNVFRLVGTTFGAALDTNFWTATKTGAGSVAALAAGIVSLTSGTANSGYGQLASVRSARYFLSNANRFQGVFRLPAVVAADTTRIWGVGTVSGQAVQDGYTFEVDGSGVLHLRSYSSGSLLSDIASGSFNGTVSVYAMDTNVHIYEITYTTNCVCFVIDGVLVHRITATTVRLSSILDFPTISLSKNSASGTTSATLEVWSSSIVRLGQEHSSPFFKNIHGVVAAQVLKNSHGRLKSVIVNGWVNGSVITIYDALTATNPIATIAPTSSGGGQLTSFSLPFDLDFYTGLTITTANATTDVTIIYE